MAVGSLGNSAPNFPSFFRLFREHWQAGTGLAAHDTNSMHRDGCWTDRTFSNAMGWAGFHETDSATIKSWLSGERWPRKGRKDAILKVFFRLPKGTSADEITRLRSEELERAWHDGQLARAPTGKTTRGGDDELDAPKRWLPAGKPIAIPGLSSVRLIDPQPGNDVDSGWFIKARMRIGPAEYEREDNTAVFIAVQEALLTVTSTGYQVATRSMIGQGVDHLNFRAETDSDSVAVVGPTQFGYLEGDPVGDETIARIVPTAEAGDEESVGVSLHAFRRSFVVSLTRSPLECIGFDEKQAVLNRFIELRLDRDAQGRVLLARDRMRRTKSE